MIGKKTTRIPEYFRNKLRSEITDKREEQGSRSQMRNEYITYNITTENNSRDDFYLIHRDEYELGTITKISVNGEMSKYVENLRLDILCTWSSEGTLNLNNYFGLNPSLDNYMFSATKLDWQRYHVLNCSTSKEMPTANEWCRAGAVNLMERNNLNLDEKPVSPNLVLLFLQRNNRLTHIPSSFFSQMPALSFLDLSNTRIRKLPSSLFALANLQVLLLTGCLCLDTLPSDIEKLKNLTVLDVLGTDLYSIPKEIGELTQLRHLHLSFFGPDYGSGYTRLPPELIPPGVISQLRSLRALSIVVHPEDNRWKKIVSDIVIHVGRLEMLRYLQFYFPTAEDLKSFIEESPYWKNKTLRRFKFIVGQNIMRIISRVPDEVESMYDQHDQCLKFVNGNHEVTEAMKSVLNHVTAFYLDHHLEIKSLSEFGISNLEGLRFCVVRECPNMQNIIGEFRSFPNLEYLGLHYLWKLERVWEDRVALGSFKELKYLMVGTCPKLEYIASHSIFECLTNLEIFIIEDCESLKSVVSENETVEYDYALFLPRLNKLVLRHLPQLVALWGGRFPLEGREISIQCCPKLNLRTSLHREKLADLHRKFLISS